MKAQKPEKKDPYREWFEREVQLGLDDIKAGRVVSHEEVIADVEKLIVSHARKHRPKAA